MLDPGAAILRSRLCYYLRVAARLTPPVSGTFRGRIWVEFQPGVPGLCHERSHRQPRLEHPAHREQHRHSDHHRGAPRRQPDVFPGPHRQLKRPRPLERHPQRPRPLTAPRSSALPPGATKKPIAHPAVRLPPGGGVFVSLPRLSSHRTHGGCLAESPRLKEERSHATAKRKHRLLR